MIISSDASEFGQTKGLLDMNFETIPPKIRYARKPSITFHISASFGVNCDMPGLHFPDTCVTDRNTVNMTFRG